MCARFDTADRLVLLIAAATARPHGDQLHALFIDVVCFCESGAGGLVSFEVLLRVILELAKTSIPLASVRIPRL